MDRKKKIALIKYDMTEKSGGERVTSILSRALCDAFDVTVISINGEGEKPYYDLDPRVGYAALLPGHERIRKTLLSGGRAIRSYVKKENFDVLMSIGGNVNSFLRSASRATKAKTVFCEHLNLIKANEDRMNAILRRIGTKIADRVVTLTERDREAYISHYKLPAERVVCIHNWIDGEVFSCAAPYDPSSRRIMTVGRLCADKGYDLLLQTAENVLPHFSDWTWDIYGDGPDREKIAEEIEKRGLHGRVVLKGSTPDLYRAYGQYGLYVLSSRVEGLPMVLLEARANHLPIVSFDCLTGPSEIVADGVNGTLVPPEDTDALSRAVGELLSDERKRVNFSLHASEGLDAFDQARITDQWVRFLRELTEK